MISALLSLGQNQNVLLVGKLKTDENSFLKDHPVYIKNNRGTTLDSVKTDSSGEFKFILDYDLEYDVWFSAKGYQTKIISFDTRVTNAEDRTWGFEYTGFTVTLQSTSEPDSPVKVALILYNESVRNFISKELVD